MKVKEVISILKTFPQDYEFAVYDIFDGLLIEEIDPKDFVKENIKGRVNIVTLQI